MNRIALLFLIACTFLACSQQPDFEGVWRNNDSATLQLRDDSIAVMGQEGIDADVDGTFWSTHDTLWIRSGVEDAQGVDMYNTFTFVYRNDSLHLIEIALHRGDDFQKLKGDEFAKRLGKRPEDMAFVRGGGEK